MTSLEAAVSCLWHCESDNEGRPGRWVVGELLGVGYASNTEHIDTSRKNIPILTAAMTSREKHRASEEGDHGQGGREEEGSSTEFFDRGIRSQGHQKAQNIWNYARTMEVQTSRYCCNKKWCHHR
jgi:hypothetical protein